MFEIFSIGYLVLWIKENYKIVIGIILALIILVRIIKSSRRDAKLKKIRQQEIAKKEALQRERIRQKEKEKPTETPNSSLNRSIKPDTYTPIQRQKTKYEQIEEAINQNPKAEKYRRETQQMTTSIEPMDIDTFMEKAKQDFVALDLETTGLDSVDDAIVEIGAVLVKNGEIVSSYHQFVNPEIPIQEEASKVNGITDEMLKGQPRIYEVLPDLLDFIHGHIAAIHNAAFDVQFINQACMRYRFKLHRKYFDTMQLKKFWPEAHSRKLQTLLDAAGIENNEAHRALGDAEATAKLIIKTMERMKPKALGL